ncbi:MAG: PelD GGDEF domain-containing protein [Burkholderiaceae bacterium]
MRRLPATVRGIGWRFGVALRDTGRRLFPRQRVEASSAWFWLWAVLETLIFCAGTLAVSLWLRPEDPFGLHAEFPWLWMVPAVLAMRYGTAIGVTAVVLMTAAWFGLPGLAFGTAPGTLDFPKSYFLGGLVLVLICGQFSDVWNARGRRFRAVNTYLEERLQTLTKNHFLLRLSHERLEQDLLAKPITLRETLLRLRGLTARPEHPGDPLPGAAEFMQLLAQSCQFEIASLFALDEDGEPLAVPLASLGAPSPLDADDPLYRFATDEGALAHVQSDAVAEELGDRSKYLICAPLRSSTGRALGMLAVERLPFFALNDDTLKLLAVLIGYYADGVQLGGAAREVLARFPACPPELALDVVRLHRIRVEAGIDSALVALVFDNDDAALDMYDQVRRLKRGVDLSWELAGARHRALVTLLPLAGAAAVEGYLLRIESALKAQFGVGLLAARIVTHKAQLGFAAPTDTLAQLVDRCAL